MSELLIPLAQWCAILIEALGIAIMTAVACYVLILAAVRFARKEPADAVYDEVRYTLGRGILLGLEFLIAADIIHTVAAELTFSTVGVLAIIVLIRTFLSFTLEMEISGRWPWQQSETKPSP